jgi:tetratricopeptide (TPR) repeat protein
MKRSIFFALPFLLFGCHTGPSAADYLREANKGLTHKIPYTKAFIAYNKVIALKPDDTIAYANRGRLEIKMHNYFGALSDFQKALALDKNMKGLYYFMGVAREQVGDHQGALLAYTKAIEYDPKNAAAFDDRAFVRQITKDEKGAFSDFSQAISMKPDSFPDAYRARGLLKIKLNDKNGACIDLHRSYKLAPDSITLHYIEMNCR